MTASSPRPDEVPTMRRAVGFALAAVAVAAVVAVLASLVLLDDGDDTGQLVADGGDSSDSADDQSDESDSSDASDGSDESDENDGSDQSDEDDGTDEGDDTSDDGDQSDDGPSDTLPGNTVPDDDDDGGDDQGIPGAQSLDDVLPDLIAFVEAERGLEFITEPEVVVQPDDEFVAGYSALIDEDIAEHADDYTQATEELQALGFLDDDVTFEQAIRSIGSDGVLGYYETEVNELFVRGDEVTPFVRAVIVHELTHALDDQHFELFRPEYDDRDDEIGFGLSSLAEGNARRVEDAYRATFTPDEEAAAFAEESSFSYDFSILRYEFLSLQIAPYVEGQEMVQAVLDDAGQPALDALFSAPPVTSEQVIHPERIDEPPATVPVPAADGEVLGQGTFGEITLQVLLESSLGFSESRDVAEGWGGDAYVSWLTADGEACVRTDMVADDADEFADLVEGLQEWADDSGATVEQPTEGVVRFTLCG